MLPPVLILSSRAQAYQSLVQTALPALELFATDRVEAARALATATPIVLGDPGLVRHILGDLPALAWVQSTWAGVDALMAGGLRRDYVLTNVRDVFGPAITEYVLGYVLMHERRGWLRYQAQQEQRWDATPPGTLRGKRMGILGVGSIGAYLARAVKSLGVTTFGYTRASETSPAIDHYFHGDQLLEFAASCDYIICTLPGTADSRHLIDAEVLAAMAPHALLINVGRGSTVDEAALVDALVRGAIGGAILDVFQQEPLPPDHPLWRLPTVIITSHTAAISFPEDIVPIFVENYSRWCAGQPLLYQVNFDLGY